MVRLSGRKGDDDLGPVTDRIGRVEGRTFTASSRGARGNIVPPTSLLLLPLLHLVSIMDSSCSTHGYSHTEYGVSSFDPYLPRPVDRGVGEEQERVRFLHIEGEADEGDDDGDGSDDDQDEGDDTRDEEQLMHVAPVAPVSGSDMRPRHGKEKGLTDSFMSVMIKIAGSHNQRPDVARKVPAPTQKRKKVKTSDWE
ncbi:hypothetical protein M9H77_12705 [Catharanthus roseus]|uniref:Uncharacterized protein n=1 Tax=Catharanthus roseus TaxID=4058 RepID=A0ACC0BIC6_CATRO|nr:hypothetical protein M9H77_12705 [Catharanthus roseus]